MWSNKTVELQAPVLLVAMPHLSGSPFAQAVILLTKHTATGSHGLVLNHPSNVTCQSFCQSLDVDLGGPGGAMPVGVGGPVQHERAVVMHGGSFQGAETETVVPGLNLSLSMESLSALAQNPPDDFRLFIGHAGWGAGQLAKEIAEGTWMLAPAQARFAFDTPPADMWHEALRAMGIEPLQLVRNAAIH